MRKRRKYKKLKKSVTVTIILLLIGSLIFVNFKDRLKTEIVQVSSFNDIINSKGFIVRDEEIIRQSEALNLDNIMFIQSGGEKVPKNSVIAKIFNSSKEVNLGYKIESVNEKIEYAEKQVNNPVLKVSEGINDLNRKINESIIRLSASNSDGNFMTSKYIKKNLWYLLNRKHFFFKNSNDINSELNMLKSKKDEFSLPDSNSISYITAPHAGVFSRYTDGYESKVSYKDLFVQDINNFDYENLAPDSLGSDVIGKIIKSNTWYAVFKLSSEEGERLKENPDVKLDILNVDSKEGFQGKAELIIPYINNQVIAVISCDYMNSDLAVIRNEDIKLNLGNYFGIKINKSCLHKQYSNTQDSEIENNEKKDFLNGFGVYVKRGNYLKFKRVNIIFSKDDFVICSQEPPYSENKEYLQAGDQIVVSGKDLYEGKKV